MPLSEHEQRILDEIERRLAAEDPKFARQVSLTAQPAESTKRVKLAGAAFGLGFALLIGGLLVPRLLVVLGLVAFGVMLGSVVVITTALKRVGIERAKDARAAKAAWFARWEERWRKRFERGEGRS